MQEQRSELIRAEHLKKYFSTPKGTLYAVDDVNFSILKGETLGVVGESGCGKSTMGRAILRLHEPTGGKVFFEGKNILDCNKKEMKELRKDMQIIFQDPFASLNPRMTVSEAIIEPLLVQGIYKPGEREAITKHVDKIMDLVGLAKRLVNTYLTNWTAAAAKGSGSPGHWLSTPSLLCVTNRCPPWTYRSRHKS